MDKVRNEMSKKFKKHKSSKSPKKKDDPDLQNTKILYRSVAEKTLDLMNQKILRQDWLIQGILESLGEFGIYDDEDTMVSQHFITSTLSQQIQIKFKFRS